MARSLYLSSMLLRHQIFALALIVIMSSEVLYHKKLYKASIPLILYFQENRTDYLVLFFKSISILGNGPAFFVLVGLIFCFGSRVQSFYYLIFMCAGFALAQGMKMAYHDPRPYMTDSRILVFSCHYEYGNPSPHT